MMTTLIGILWILAYILVGLIHQGVVRRIHHDLEDCFGYMITAFWPLVLPALICYGILRVLMRGEVIVEAIATAEVPTLEQIKERLRRPEPEIVKESPLPIPHKGQRQ